MFLIRSLVAVGLLVASVPVVFGVTLVLLPLWSWIEATYAIESIGHSGPASWCFAAVYGVLVALMLVVVLRWRHR